MLMNKGFPQLLIPVVGGAAGTVDREEGRPAPIERNRPASEDIWMLDGVVI